MVNAHLDILELELRKLNGVRSVGFTSQHDVLYIQLFAESNAPTATMPFEATRIAQRHSNSPVAVEIVRWENSKATAPQNESLFTPSFAPIDEVKPVADEEEAEELMPYTAQHDFSISEAGPEEYETTAPAGQDDLVTEDEAINEEDFVSNELSLEEEPTLDEVLGATSEDTSELNLAQAEQEEAEEVEPQQNETLEPFAAYEAAGIEEPSAEVNSSSVYDNIEILTVTTSAGNHEIEVHLAHDETRTIGRAATDRGLLGAIDATINAVNELLGDSGFEAEWARSLEPTDDQASLVAVGLTSTEGDSELNGMSGGNSPIEAAAKATLNALSNKTATALSEA